MEFILLVFNLYTTDPDRIMFRHTSMESCRSMALSLGKERTEQGKNVFVQCIPEKVENIFEKVAVSI